MNAITTGSRFRTVFAIVLVGGVVSGFAVKPAHADSFDVPQVTVKFADLDISRPAGAARLYGRIKTAATMVCSSFDRSGLAAQVNFKACVSDAIARAVAKVDSPSLYAVYSAKTGKGVPMRRESVAK